MRSPQKGDGKIDMGNGRRLYPCDARAELAAKFPPKTDSEGNPSPDKWAWQYMWPNEITTHHHGGAK